MMGGNEKSIVFAQKDHKNSAILGISCKLRGTTGTGRKFCATARWSATYLCTGNRSCLSVAFKMHVSVRILSAFPLPFFRDVTIMRVVGEKGGQRDKAHVSHYWSCGRLPIQYMCGLLTGTMIARWTRRKTFGGFFIPKDRVPKQTSYRLRR